MHSVPLQRQRAIDLPPRIPAVTMIRDWWPLGTHEARLTMQLPAGAATTVVVPGGAPICRSERRMLDAHKGLHSVMLVADNVPAGPDKFDAALVAWALRRSQVIVIWGCGAYPATIAAVEALLRPARRVVMVMCDAYTEAEWLAFADEHAPIEARVQALLTDSSIAPGTLAAEIRRPRRAAR